MSKTNKKIILNNAASHHDVVSDIVVPYYTNLVASLIYGMYKLIGLGLVPPSNDATESELIPIIRKGLNWKNLSHLMNTTGLSLQQISGLLHISERTLHRYKDDSIFNPEISERILELAKIYAKGQEVFGNMETFNQWMHFPSWALNNRTPLSFLDTSIGVKMIEDEIGRIEHGVLA
jgi:putative toxin-antitoxin system antitoxin component (TIGR02293 family)